VRTLLDTQLLLWALHDPDRLPKAIRVDLADRRQEVFFSAASIWEIGIKVSRVCPTCLTARSSQSWRIMDRPAEIGNGLVNLERVLTAFV
jgi:hypothetical protein